MKCEALENIDGGVYLVSAKNAGFDNGCIINAVMKASDEPPTIVAAVEKAAKTCDIICRTGQFNITVLTDDVPLETIRHFGEVSGAEADKFKDNAIFERSLNGICYLNTYSSAFVSGRVTDSKDLDSHMIFLAQITESRIFNNLPPLSYAKYKTLTEN